MIKRRRKAPEMAHYISTDFHILDRISDQHITHKEDGNTHCVNHPVVNGASITQHTHKDTGDTRLWRAVIYRALEDLTAKESGRHKLNRSSAQSWIFDGSKDFKDVCEYADIDPYVVKEIARHIIDTRDKQQSTVH